MINYLLGPYVINHIYMFSFGYLEAGNDWWWAIDNLEIRARKELQILRDPQSWQGPAGQTVVFSVQADGELPLNYQWILK